MVGHTDSRLATNEHNIKIRLQRRVQGMRRRFTTANTGPTDGRMDDAPQQKTTQAKFTNVRIRNKSIFH